MATPETVLPERATTPAHRDGNVLRWLTAYTVSLVGDGLRIEEAVAFWQYVGVIDPAGLARALEVVEEGGLGAQAVAVRQLVGRDQHTLGLLERLLEFLAVLGLR